MVDGTYADEWLFSLISTDLFKPAKSKRGETGWTVHDRCRVDRCCVNRLGQSARAVGDGQGGRL